MLWMLMVLIVTVVLMVVTNLVLIVVAVVVVEMEVVVVCTSLRVDRGVGDVQQGEHRPPHHFFHPTPLVQLGELLLSPSTMHCSSPTTNTPILTSRPSHGGCGTHSETKDTMSRFLGSTAAAGGLGLESDP